MYQKNKNILGDIVILTNIIKDALKQEKLETIVELYDYYRLLAQAIKATKIFTKGYFTMDINLPLFQETESFLSPEMKWAHLTQEQLKKFNDEILKFIKQSILIGFPTHSSIKKTLFCNLSSYNRKFIPSIKYDNKFEFSDTYKEIYYQYIHIKQSSNKQLNCSDIQKNLYTHETFCIDTIEQRKQLVDGIHVNLEKLEDFKLYLEEYFLDNGITKNMFVNVVYDNLQQYQITPQTIS